MGRVLGFSQTMVITSAQQKPKPREFAFTQKDFEFVRQLLYQQAGIVLSDIKHDMVYNRLTKRLRALQLTRVEDYLALLQQPSSHSEEMVHFINSLTTNLTAFFREPHHFDYLKAIAPEILSRQGRIRVWSSACSVGEEPYSIAMCLDSVLKPGQRVEIVATDIDTNVLKTAQFGTYDIDRISKLPEKLIKKHFLKGHGQRHGLARIKPHLRQMIEFKSLNLIGDWPKQPPFDVIFCRNVMIYFEKKTQHQLIDRMANLLTPKGYLFIGHSESLHSISTRFTPVGQTIYQRVS